MIKLLAFERYPDNRLGGQERSLFEVLQGTAKCRIRSTLAYSEPGNLLPEYAKFLNGMIEIRSSTSFSYRTAFKFFSTLIQLLIRHLFRERWEVIYVNQYAEITLPIFLGILIRRPVVAHLRLPPPTMGISRRYKWALNHCTKLIAVSEFNRRAHQQEGITAPIEVIHNGTDLSFFTPTSSVRPSDVTRILYLGRVLPDKGVHTLVRACHLAAQKCPLRLTVAGNPFPNEETRAYYQYLKKEAAYSSYASVFIEHVEDVRPLLADADLVVLPSHWPEPFGRVIIEAMACEIPVIASNVGGIPEILAPHFQDCLIEPDEPEALAQAIQSLAHWRTEQPDLGHRMRQHVSAHFDANVTHQRIFQLLLKTIGKASTMWLWLPVLA
jgi:glycosyltransferase involved in cell wall biosynthesis